MSSFISLMGDAQKHGRDGNRSRERHKRAHPYVLRLSPLAALVAIAVISWMGILFLRVGWISGQQAQRAAQCASKLGAAGLQPPEWGLPGGSSEQSLTTLARRHLYEEMGAQISHSGLAVGGASQGLGMGDLFSVTADGGVHAVLRRAAVPVRAVVAPLGSGAAADALAAAVGRHLEPLLPAQGVWMQDRHIYHTTLFHASPHKSPVVATASQVEAEVEAVRKLASGMCPIQVVLERVITTPTGAVIACWQVLQGAEPSRLRRKLAEALPRAPEPSQQAFSDPIILHTTLARILQPPSLPSAGLRRSSPPGTDPTDAAAVLNTAMAGLSNELCGLQATLDELWFVEEEDLLAMALNGRWKKRSAPLLCLSPEAAAAADTADVAPENVPGHAPIEAPDEHRRWAAHDYLENAEETAPRLDLVRGLAAPTNSSMGVRGLESQRVGGGWGGGEDEGALVFPSRSRRGGGVGSGGQPLRGSTSGGRVGTRLKRELAVGFGKGAH